MGLGGSGRARGEGGGGGSPGSVSPGSLLTGPDSVTGLEMEPLEGLIPGLVCGTGRTPR